MTLSPTSRSWDPRFLEATKKSAAPDNAANTCKGCCHNLNRRENSTSPSRKKANNRDWTLKIRPWKRRNIYNIHPFWGCLDLFVLGRVPCLSNNSRKWRFSLVRDFSTDKCHLESGEWNPRGHLNKYCMEYKEIIFYSWLHSLKLT